MSLSESEFVEPAIPSKRTGATAHLARAAKTSVGSAAETYCLNAAIAESLVDLVDTLRAQNRALWDLVEASQLQTKVTIAKYPGFKETQD